MSTPLRRRNGSQASCEPCRRGKMRCNHQHPICGQCRRRGLGSECVYRTAPLTKARSEVASGRRCICGANSDISSMPERDVALPVPQSNTEAALIETVGQILLSLRFITEIDKLIHKYYSLSQLSSVPKLISLSLLDAVKGDIKLSQWLQNDNVDAGGDNRTFPAVHRILKSSRSDVNITPLMDVPAFCALFIEDNLRIESLGLLFTLAARSAQFSIIRGEKQIDGFIQSMFRSSNLSLQLARTLSPQPNDISVWLAYENMHLTQFVDGDGSYSGWQRAGELATDILALGFNREETHSAATTPFFLAESRRKTFSSTYYLDKISSTIFGRPPRISFRHSNCRPPLDLPDEVVFTNDPAVLEKERNSLREDGWSTIVEYRNTAWARLRFMIGKLREEIDEYDFKDPQPTDETNLRDLSRRAHEAWLAVPTHLRYDTDCWTSEVPFSVCLMLSRLHLSYLYVQSQIYKQLSRGYDSPLPEFLRISASMLDTVVQTCTACDSTFIHPSDLPGYMLLYAVPSAVMLMTELESTVRDPSRSLPTGLARSSIIRNLSVLVSQLQSVSTERGHKYQLCQRASRGLSTKLDQILDMPVTVQDRPTGRSVDSVFLTPEFEAVDTQAMDLGDLEGLDFETWATNLDFGACDNEWNLF